MRIATIHSLAPMLDCSKKLVRKSDLQRHHQSTYKKDISHVCDPCRIFVAVTLYARTLYEGMESISLASKRGRRLQKLHLGI